MLTEKEKSWLNRMQRLLDQAPEHFEFNTVGDCDVTVFDNRKMPEIDAIYEGGKCEFCSAISDAGAEVDTLRFKNNVHSSAG